MALQANTTGGSDAPKTKESALLEHLRRIEYSRGGFFAVRVNLSRLKASNRQPHFLRIAHRAYEPLANNPDVTIFHLDNADTVLLCREVPIEEIDGVIEKVRGLFSEDPLVQDEGGMEDNFSSWYDLTQDGDYKSLIDLISDQEVAAQARADMQAEQAAGGGRAAQAMGGEPLAPENLTQVNTALQDVRLVDLIESQPVIKVMKGAGKLAFREHFVNMSNLQKRIAPDTNLFASHWLFQYLSETLDIRVLNAMGNYDFEASREPVSLNLNISTVISRPFQAFHEKIGDHAKNVVVELQVIDVFADLGGYAYARDWLQEHGYRVLIDGLSPLSLNFFDPSDLKADFYKIAWGADVAGGVADDQNARIREVVKSLDPGAVVLARIDSEKGVQWGLSLGVRCFQGRFIDRVVSAMAAKGKL